MIRYYKYTFFEDEKDFEANTRTETYRDDFWFGGGYLSEKPKEFPVTYKYIEPWDAHFCGTWVEADSEELIESIRSEIKTLNNWVKQIEKEGK